MRWVLFLCATSLLARNFYHTGRMSERSVRYFNAEWSRLCCGWKVSCFLGLLLLCNNGEQCKHFTLFRFSSMILFLLYGFTMYFFSFYLDVMCLLKSARHRTGRKIPPWRSNNRARALGNTLWRCLVLGGEMLSFWIIFNLLGVINTDALDG